MNKIWAVSTQKKGLFLLSWGGAAAQNPQRDFFFMINLASFVRYQIFGVAKWAK